MREQQQQQEPRFWQWPRFAIASVIQGRASWQWPRFAFAALRFRQASLSPSISLSPNVHQCVHSCTYVHMHTNAQMYIHYVGMYVCMHASKCATTHAWGRPREEGPLLAPSLIAVIAVIQSLPSSPSDSHCRHCHRCRHCHQTVMAVRTSDRHCRRCHHCRRCRHTIIAVVAV